MAHDGKLSGHLGTRKTLERIRSCFYWPGMRADVARWCRTCDICQKMGKPNQVIKDAPLVPIPKFDEPFSRVLMDVVGPLPRTSGGNQYMLTIMDMATRFPEAIPLRSVKTPVIARELIKFFTKFGLPCEVQSDQATYFTSHTMKEVLKELGIQQIHSSTYHPQSQGALERFHQTLKSMLKKYCHENCRDWDQGLPLVLFAIREVPNESLGFSPFELLFTHPVRGPLKLLKDRWRSEKKEGSLLIKSVGELRERLRRAWNLAGENLGKNQVRVKKWYDKRARRRTFQVGEEVLLLSPTPGRPLSCKFKGPYAVLKKMSDVNYVISTPDKRRKETLCHINLIKKYYKRDEEGESTATFVVAPTVAVHRVEDEEQEEVVKLDKLETSWRDNESFLMEMPKMLQHLSEEEACELGSLLQSYEDVFRSTPGRTTLMQHDVDVQDSKPVKQRAYRVNPRKARVIREELDYMLKHDLIEPCSSEWSSPVTLVDKPGGSVRFCIDYRTLNKVSKTDSYPLPRVDECIDTVANAKYITKLDLLKGFWQVPLTSRAKELSCFVTLGKTYKCTVMPFGMKNASATFQRLMNLLTRDLKGCVAYIDDLIVHSNSWSEHLVRLEGLLKALREANLVVKLSKCEFVHAQVNYLGYVVGHGTVAPPDAKVKAICEMTHPKTRKEVRRILGMAGYYRQFIMNFSDVVAPLTDLLKKDRKFMWTPDCDDAFQMLKVILSSSPLLAAPNFDKPFKLAVDASNLGIGAVLIQDDCDNVERPVSYYSKKFNKAQLNYSVIEKELLALILALQFYNVYVSPSDDKVVVYTDHHPLKYLNKFQNKNQRLTRWSLLLQEYNLEMIHVKGRDNVVPDLLSRT